MNRAKKAIALTIVLAGGLCACPQASTGNAQTYVSRSGYMNLGVGRPSSFLLARQMEDSVTVHSLDSLRLKDPNMALLYAVIPGVLIHGSGHIYAGKTGTGAALLGAGVVGGLYVLYWSTGQRYPWRERRAWEI